MLKARSSDMIQKNLFQAPASGIPPRKFISTFRVFDDKYYSFADNGIIKRIYDKLG